jgi:hypothetical protein
MSRETTALTDEFIGEIFDGVPQNLQRMACFRTYPPLEIPSHVII